MSWLRELMSSLAKKTFAQVIGDGAWADEQLCGDPPVRGTPAGKAGDLRFLSAKIVSRVDGAFAGALAARAQLDALSFGEGVDANRVEDFVRTAKLIAGITSPPLATGVVEAVREAEHLRPR